VLAAHTVAVASRTQILAMPVATTIRRLATPVELEMSCWRPAESETRCPHCGGNFQVDIAAQTVRTVTALEERAEKAEALCAAIQIFRSGPVCLRMPEHIVEAFDEWEASRE